MSSDVFFRIKAYKLISALPRSIEIYLKSCEQDDICTKIDVGGTVCYFPKNLQFVQPQFREFFA